MATHAHHIDLSNNSSSCLLFICVSIYRESRGCCSNHPTFELSFKHKKKAMASFSHNDSRCHVRSISFPSRSHPSTLRIEEELSKLTMHEASPTAEAICSGLSGLEELYNCMDHLLNLPLTQQAFSHHQHEEWLTELLDGSVKLLDICSITRDNVLKIKESVGVIQSALRRRKGDSSISKDITNYISFRKMMKKDAKKLIATLKQMDHKFGASSLLDKDDHLSSLIRVLREVSLVNISIFQSLLLFLSVPVSKVKPSELSLVSKLLNRRVAACEIKREDVNELERVDFALSRYNSSEVKNIQIANEELKALENSIECLENGLEGMFRRLIKSRTALLNIVSQ